MLSTTISEKVMVNFRIFSLSPPKRRGSAGDKESDQTKLVLTRFLRYLSNEIRQKIFSIHPTGLVDRLIVWC